MTDIVKRLRDLDTATCEDAADEIERLRREKQFIIEERDRTFALMLARAERVEAALLYQLVNNARIALGEK